MVFYICLVALLLVSLEANAQVAKCPTTFPKECSCTDNTRGPSIYCLTIRMDTWDIRATFDAISTSINNNSAVMWKVRLDGYNLTNKQEIPAYSISTLKTEVLEIGGNYKFTRIHPQAFSGSHSTLKELHVFQMEFPDPQEAFDLFNKHEKIKFLNIDATTTLTAIPAYAFAAGLLDLRQVFIQGAGVEAIGDYAFWNLQGVQHLSLVGNNLTLDSISNTAFNFNNQTGSILFSMTENFGISHLPQEKFANFLTKDTWNSLFVGPGYSEVCHPQYFLSCDARMNWFCDAEWASVDGYKCLENEFLDIYDYCDKTFGFNPRDKIDAEELEQREMTVRLRHEKFRIEQEFRQRSIARSLKHPNLTPS